MTTTIAVQLEDDSLPLTARSVTGVERLGEPARHEIELVSPTPVETAAVLGKACGIHLRNEAGELGVSLAETLVSRPSRRGFR